MDFQFSYSYLNICKRMNVLIIATRIMVRFHSEIFNLIIDIEAGFTAEQPSRNILPSSVFSGYSILVMNNNEREESARHDNSRAAMFYNVLMQPLFNANIMRIQDQIIRYQYFVNVFGVAARSHAIVRIESSEEEIFIPLSNIIEEFGTYTWVTTAFPLIIVSQAILNVDDILMEVQIGIYSRSNSTIRGMTLINTINIANFLYEDQFLMCIRFTDLLRAISLPREHVGVEMMFVLEEISRRLRFISAFNISLGYITNIISTFHTEQSELYEDGATGLPATAVPPDIDRVERIFVDAETTILFGFISRLEVISVEPFNNISAFVHQEQLESNAGVADELPAIAPLTDLDRVESVILDEDITTHFGFVTVLTNVSLEYIFNTSTTVHQDQLELYAGVTDEFPAIAPPYHFTRFGRVFNEEEITRNVSSMTVVNDISPEPEHITNTAVTVQWHQVELHTQITTEVTSHTSLYDFVRAESIFTMEEITRNLGFISVLTDITTDLIANISASL